MLSRRSKGGARREAARELALCRRFATRGKLVESGAPRTRTWNRRFWRPVPLGLAIIEWVALLCCA